MIYTYRYITPIGFDDIIIESDGENLTKLVFEKEIDKFSPTLATENPNLQIFKLTKKWLDEYFQGKEPSFTPPYKIIPTPFRKRVYEILLTIPYGKPITYGDIAKLLASEKGIKKMSAQAVGGALNKNCICIIVPCHRVIGQSGNLVGFGGKVKNKIKLLELEGNDMSKYYYKGDLND